MPARKESFVVVANRLPVRRVQREGISRWETSPGGLVSALESVLKGKRYAWVGWPGIAGKAPAPFSHGGIRHVPVKLSTVEVDRYYGGFSNRTLWPLYHDAIRPPEFHRRWWRPYLRVNRRFAERVAEIAAPDATIWVHDYHLQLLPAMLRELLPEARIGFFLHIPFPPEELFMKIPWRRQLVEGLLGADVIGFQTRLGTQNFLRLARRLTDASGTGSELGVDGRKVLASPFPISIDVGRFEKLAASGRADKLVRKLRSQLGEHRKVILGVDRLDYTKGIDIRLRAFESLIERERRWARDAVFVQVAVPSREKVQEYADIRSLVEQHVGHLNGTYGEAGLSPVHYLYRNLPQEDLVAYYRLADVSMVTPFRDGMNLVAKEYVASRPDNSGVLILSEFAGAAHELRRALLVNPYDIDGLAHAMERALTMPAKEMQHRMAALRRSLRGRDVFAWADAFLRALAP